MKIVKAHIGFKMVYDTEDVFTIKEYTDSTRDLEPLHQSNPLTDYEFLKQYFSESHSIFFDFGNSFFYKLDSL